MTSFTAAFVGKGLAVHAMHVEGVRKGVTACGRTASRDNSPKAHADYTCQACLNALPSWVGIENKEKARLRAAQIEALGLQPVRVDDVMQVIRTGEWGYVMDIDGMADDRIVYLRLYGAHTSQPYQVQTLAGYTTEDEAVRKAAERAEQTAVTTLWVDDVDGDTWERNEATGQVRVVAFADGTTFTITAWGPACPWTFESVQANLKLTLTPLDSVHAGALELNRIWGCGVTIITGGELHEWPADLPPADFMLNLTRLLRDPAHVPTGELLDLRGDQDEAVVEFVMATRGAKDLVTNTTITALDIATYGPVTIYVLCRGGKHRAPVIGNAIRAELEDWGATATARHLHAHLDRVITGE